MRKQNLKVGEEAEELGAAERNEDIVAELADILDVIDAIKEMFGISETDLREAQAINAEKKGGFGQRLLLEWSNASQKGS